MAGSLTEERMCVVRVGEWVVALTPAGKVIGCGTPANNQSQQTSRDRPGNKPLTFLIHKRKQHVPPPPFPLHLAAPRDARQLVKQAGPAGPLCEEPAGALEAFLAGAEAGVSEVNLNHCGKWRASALTLDAAGGRRCRLTELAPETAELAWAARQAKQLVRVFREV